MRDSDEEDMGGGWWVAVWVLGGVVVGALAVIMITAGT